VIDRECVFRHVQTHVQITDVGRVQPPDPVVGCAERLERFRSDEHHVFDLVRVQLRADGRPSLQDGDPRRADRSRVRPFVLVDRVQSFPDLPVGDSTPPLHMPEVNGTMAVRRGVLLPVSFDRGRLAEWCRRWKVQGLAVFGSALRADFGLASDVDLLVTFEPNAEWSLIDHVRMEEELTDIIGRKVDLVNRAGLARSANWIRRQAIFETARPLDVEG